MYSLIKGEKLQVIDELVRIFNTSNNRRVKWSKTDEYQSVLENSWPIYTFEGNSSLFSRFTSLKPTWNVYEIIRNSYSSEEFSLNFFRFPVIPVYGFLLILFSDTVCNWKHTFLLKQ